MNKDILKIIIGLAALVVFVAYFLIFEVYLNRISLVEALLEIWNIFVGSFGVIVTIASLADGNYPVWRRIAHAAAAALVAIILMV